MKPSKKIAVVLAGALAAAGVAVIAAPNAQAFGPSAQGIPASLFLGNTPAATNATTNNTYNDTFSLTTSPAGTVNAGNTVTVTLAATTGAFTGPVPLSAGTQIIRSTVSITGAQSGSVSMLDPNSAGGTVCGYPLTPIGTNSAQGAWSTVGTYTASGNGAVVLKLRQIFFDDQGNLDGSVANVCAGTANNADYYASAVTQTAGSGLPGIAKTAPADSNVIVEPIAHVGPNAAAGVATYQTVTGYVRAGNAGGPPNTTAVTVPLTGTVWGANVASGGFVSEWCDPTGTTCDVVSGGVANTLVTDGSGNLSGTVRAPSGITTGNRAIKLTQGANTSLTPMVVLAPAGITLSPVSGGPGTSVTVTGSSFNPSQVATIRGASDGVPTFTATSDPSINATASGTGSFSASFTVNDAATVNILASQGTPGAPGASNPAAFAAFTVNADRCVAYNSNQTGGPGCFTKQNVTVSILQGRLVQRAYVNTAPTVGSVDGSAITTPVQGTSNVNSAATQVNLGTITSPFAPTNITGTLNDITVSDNRGGTFGWSLTAALIDPDGAGPATDGFNAATSQTIAKGQLSTLGAGCVAATNATAWDYNAVGKTAIAGFDDTLNAPGVTAGADTAFSGVVNLCTKSTAVNAITQTTGGVYNVTSNLVLEVPAFQSAAQYTAVMQITLA